MTTTLRIVRGNIVELQVDAVVNAANSTLLGGGGVDGAIHYAAGPDLLAACRKLGGCPTGEARITPGFLLKARWVIHTVGPIWKGGGKGEEELLASCYREALILASEHGIRTIAFPAISTGAYAYPVRLATATAIATVRKYIEQDPSLDEVLFCCHSGEDYAIYKRVLHAADA